MQSIALSQPQHSLPADRAVAHRRWLGSSDVATRVLNSNGLRELLLMILGRQHMNFESRRSF